LRTTPLIVGARGSDCITTLNASSVSSLQAAGIEFCGRYLTSLTTGEVAAITAKVPLVLFTYADAFEDPTPSLRALGIPSGADVILDVEGIGSDMTAANLIARIDAWAAVVVNNGWIAKAYIGANAQLTSEEWYARPQITGYCKGQSRLLDRNGALVEPSCGWQLVQAYPSVSRGGVNVDLDFAYEDYSGRVIHGVVA
jgi:hypothetical protein